jgi:hypothetical protein
MILKLQHYVLLALSFLAVMGPHLVGFVPVGVAAHVVAYGGPPVALLTTLISILSTPPVTAAAAALVPAAPPAVPK